MPESYDILITRLDSSVRVTTARTEIIHKLKVYFYNHVDTHKTVKLSPNVFDTSDIFINERNEVRYRIRLNSTLYKVLNRIGANLTKTIELNSQRILELK